MKHVKLREILCVITLLALVTALAAVYAHIGLQEDIRFVKRECTRKMSSLTTSISELKISHTLVNFDYFSILLTNAYLSSLPLRDMVDREGDGAIRMYNNAGCIVKLDGDQVVLPENFPVPTLEVSAFKDENGAIRDWGEFAIYTDEEAEDDEETDPESLEENSNQEIFCTFLCMRDDYYYLDFSPATAFYDFMNTRVNFSEILSNLESIYGGHIVIFYADDKDHTLNYKSANVASEIKTIGDLGIDPNAPDDSVNIIEVNGEDCVYALSEPLDIPDINPNDLKRVALIVPIGDLSARRIPRLVVAICISLLFFITATCWVLSSRRVFLRPAITAQQRKQYGAERIRRSVIAIGLAGTLSLGLITFFINCLTQLYIGTQNNQNLLEQINNVATQTQQRADLAKTQQDGIYVNYARRIADLLTEYPQLKTREKLAEFCEIIEADYLMIYDDHGREVLSNGPYVNLAFSRDPEAPSYDFRLLLTGVPSVVHDSRVDELTLLDRQLVGVCMDDGNISDGYGALIMAVLPESRKSDVMTQDQLMQNMTPEDGLCIALEPETGIIRHASDPNLIGENALNLGMAEKDLKGGLMDHFTLNGQRWYSSSDSFSDLVYHSATRADAIYRRLPTVALYFSGCFLAAYAVLALVLMTGYTERRIDERGPRVVEDDEALPSVKERSTKDRASLFTIMVEHLRVNHVGQTPEQKTRFTFSLVTGIMLVSLMLYLYMNDAGRDRFHILYYVLNGKWTPGINLFAFAKILILSLITALVVLALRLVTGTVCALLQRRGETIVRLVSSFFQYVTVLIFVFSAFDCLGFDTRALLASVGILSLAVSLGAKDLVSDVLSGITIAFSDEYQIGDYIEINGFRGWVQVIGVRTTTLVNNDGNIKHFSNRDVKNILNLSRRNCQYTVNVTIASDQSLRQVEEILNSELPHIAETTPEIIKGPVYKGVTGFAAGGVTIAISAECKEQNYGKVRSHINREIRLILEKNGIVIR